MSPNCLAMDLHISHLEIRVEQLEPMVDFYTEVLGFVVTDASTGPDAMVFLSRSSAEHHQIVLAAASDSGTPERVDHLAFRLGSFEELRAYYRLVDLETAECVSHGTSWSFYVRDPDGNRLEFFADTPWHVAQPARWPIDIETEAKDLDSETLDRVKSMPGYSAKSEWNAEHGRRISRDTQNEQAVMAASSDSASSPPDLTDRVAISSHRTGQGILTYYRQPTGRVIAQLRRYP
jgi:catechol 2,3-dioxygenase